MTPTTRVRQAMPAFVLAALLIALVVAIPASATHHNHSQTASQSYNGCFWDGRNAHVAGSDSVALWGLTRNLSGGGPTCSHIQIKLWSQTGGTAEGTTMGLTIDRFNHWHTTHCSDHNANAPGIGWIGFRLDPTGCGIP